MSNNRELKGNDPNSWNPSFIHNGVLAPDRSPSCCPISVNKHPRVSTVLELDPNLVCEKTVSSRISIYVIVLTTSCVVPVFAEPTKQVDIHVATTGRDFHPGTADRPIRSLGQVLKRLAQLRQKQTQANIRVILHKGTHRLEQPLVVTPKHMPAKKFRVTFQSAKGETALISGGVAISNWKLQDDGNLSASLADINTDNLALRELFVNGNRARRARHPNTGYFRIEKAGQDRRTSFFAKSTDKLKTVGDVAELVFLHDWSISRIPVKSFDSKTNRLVVRYPIGCIADHYKIDHFERNPRYYLEGDLAFLDQPGEWAWNAKRKTLIYKPKPGETAENIQAVIPTLGQLVVIMGNSADLVRNLHFKGLTFSHAQWALPAGGYASGQATVHEYRNFEKNHSSRRMMDSSIVFQHAEQCSIVDCRISQIGLSGISFAAHTRRCRIVGNVFEDISGNCINIGEDGSRRVKGKTWWQVAPTTGASDHVIANNLIRKGGIQFFGSVGVWVGLANRIYIHHNEIRDLPYTGVSLGWKWDRTNTNTGGHRVEYNHIHHVMQRLSDGGGIYTLGRQPGTVLKHNHIHHIPLNAGRAESNGMFLDQGSDLIRIESNCIHDVEKSPLRFHKAWDVTVVGNVLVHPEGVPTLRYNNTKPATIRKRDNVAMTQTNYRKQYPQDKVTQVLGAGVEPEFRKLLDGIE